MYQSIHPSSSFNALWPLYSFPHLVFRVTLHIKRHFFLFRLSSVELESAEKVTDASEIPEGEEVLSVEMCECPQGYHGFSCESCAVGYFRQSDGPFGPICAECQCHGHADICHPITGQCVSLVPIDETVLETLEMINIVEYCHFRPDLCKIDDTVEVRDLICVNNPIST